MSGIEVITEIESEILDPGALWQPVLGSEGLALLDTLKVDSESRENLVSEATSVLARCVPPTQFRGQSTGLVIGYVQSGKTASFTTVAALARDNGYRLVIVLSGLTTNLFKQSFARLEKDLRTDEGRKRWLSISNPVASDLSRIDKTLSASSGSSSTRVVLLTVMKNRSHLDNLANILERLTDSGVPALVIDDEADQASLNNEVRRDGESATYRRLLQIRRALPHHTYLQYTATPQGPLLINLIDTLSPNFVVVLTPGASYTGGERFFASHLDLVREIPPDELPSKEAELEAPPSSFLAALRLFYLGVAAGLIEGDGDPLGNRSMMIHPSSKQVLHSIYDRWAHAITENWSEIIRLGQDDPQDDEYQGFINEMKAAHSDLGQSVEDLPSFDDLLENLLESISDTELLKVNSSKGNSPQPNWKQHYSHILTGGDILNRGFTVEGLTVSYMPRGLGTGQVDTIQQRARWFGYKEDYLGYCRVFLSADAIRVYESYIDHEEEMRKSLREYAATGLELAGWKRVFFLSSNLQPTRHSILDSEYRRGNFQDKWFRTRAPHQNLTAIENNRKLVAELRRQYESQWAVDPGSDKRSDAQRHLLITDVPLKDIYSSFLTQFSCPNSSDSTDLVGLLLQVGVYLESHPAETCGVYLIRQGVARRRSLTEKDEINELFQGWDPVGEPNAAKRNYPGDDAIHLDGRLSVQIHNLDLLKDGKVEKEDVPALAVWVPKAMGGSWIAQVPS